MEPRESGWLKQFLQATSKNQQAVLSNLEDIFEGDVLDNFLYGSFQPTGIMYGHADVIPGIDVEDTWDEKFKIKILLSYCFSQTRLTLAELDTTQPSPDNDIISKDIYRYYRHTYPRFARRPFLSVFKRESQIEAAERVINRRIKISSSWQQSFWSSFFHNSLLFLDVIFFAKWKAGLIPGNDLRLYKLQATLTVLKTMAAAAHANDIVEAEEKELYLYFVQSAQLPEDLEDEAELFLEDGITLEEIDFSLVDFWIFKKYIFELAILTIWSDKVVTETERSFVSELAAKLGISMSECEESLLAIEAFVLKNYEKVHYLGVGGNYKVVSDQFTKRMRFVTKRFSGQLKQEISESKELMALLGKSRKEKLTEEEKEKVRVQLLDILKTIPLFVIIGLPFTFLTLPVLIKILPKSVFPTSFQE